MYMCKYLLLLHHTAADHIHKYVMCAEHICSVHSTFPAY